MSATRSALATQWTAPYFGVQHLGEFSTKAKWASVTDYGTFASACFWFPGCGFSPIESEHATAADARAACELWMTEGRTPCTSTT